jgi:hypothetical protein
MNRPRSLRDSDLHRLIAAVLSLGAAATLAAQTPGLQMNVTYLCPALQAALKVYSCAGTAAGDWCDVETVSPGRPASRGKSTRQQVMTVLAVCHVQTAAEAKGAASGGGPATASAGPQVGAGGFKVGDNVQVSTAGGFMDAKILQVRGNSYFVHAANGGEVWKSYPGELRRIGKLTMEDHANGQYDLHDRVQVLVNGRWVESEIHGYDGNGQFEVDVPGGNQAWVPLQSIRPSTAPPPGPPKGGIPPRPGLTSCAGKYEGRYATTGGFGSFQVTFRSGKAIVSGGLGADETLECWMGGGKLYLHKPGDDPKVDMPIDINDDGTLQTPLGEIKRKGN